MKKILILLILFIFPKIFLAQTCLHKNLSKEFNFKIILTKIKIPNEEIDNNSVKVIIINKKTNQKQEINYGASFLFGKTFENCETVRSYSTNINKNAEIEDNDFGDLIIADFDFDNREDFAIKNDSGGNGGPTYNYYIQNENNKFILDKYLTKKMEFFPRKLNPKSKELVTYVHANAYQLNEQTFAYNSKSKKWKIKKQRFVEHF